MRSLIRLIGLGFIVAIFIWTIYLVQVEMLASMFQKGYNYGEQSCPQEGVEPEGATEDEIVAKSPHTRNKRYALPLPPS